MTNLHWDYEPRANGMPEYLASYGALKLRAVHDDCPVNPFDDWDGHLPMIVDYRDRGHSFTNYDKAKGASIDAPLSRFSDGQIIRHQKAILEALGGNEARYYNTLTGNYSATVADDFADHVRDYREEYSSMADCKRDYFERALDAVSNSDKLEALASLYRVIGIPALCTSSQGYTQGSYAELLIVATPEAMDEFGWSKAHRADAAAIERDMEAQAKLYGAWAWGDVYGYAIEDSDGETLDSCFGYYGDDFTESGLEEAAIDAAEYIAGKAREARASRLADLIRNRVPLHLRPAMLEDAGTCQPMR